MGSSANYTASVILKRKNGKSKLLSDISSDIYCKEFSDSEDINERTESFKITQKFIDSLVPGDKIILSGDGDSY